MAMQIDVSDFSQPASMEQVEDEYTRMEIIALTYWMRYELFLGIRDPYVIGDEMQSKMAAIMRQHEERKRAVEQRQNKVQP